MIGLEDRSEKALFAVAVVCLVALVVGITMSIIDSRNTERELEYYYVQCYSNGNLIYEGTISVELYLPIPMAIRRDVATGEEITLSGDCIKRKINPDN